MPDKQPDTIVNKEDQLVTGSKQAGQIAPSSPFQDDSDNRRDPQAHAAAGSADNDMDRLTEEHHNLQKDAEEAQSDGNLSFPEGK